MLPAATVVVQLAVEPDAGAVTAIVGGLLGRCGVTRRAAARTGAENRDRRDHGDRGAHLPDRSARRGSVRNPRAMSARRFSGRGAAHNPCTAGTKRARYDVRCTYVSVTSSSPSTDEEHAGDALERRARPPQPCGEARRRREPERGEQERHADAGRVRAEQQRAAPDRPACGPRSSARRRAAARRTGSSPRRTRRRRRTGAATPVTLGSVGISRRSRANGPRSTPSSARPITVMTTPPTISDRVLERRQRRAEQPGGRAEPGEHRGEAGDEQQRGGHGARGSCASPISPTMMPRYAGTSGTMHGARNDATPAPNSATTWCGSSRRRARRPTRHRR